MEPEELAGAIKRLTDWAERHAPEPEPAARPLGSLPPEEDE